MSQRIAKVESLVQQVVAKSLIEVLPGESARLTITGVDVSPDIRSATVWVGVLADDEPAQQALFDRVVGMAGVLQQQLARVITTKFVPRLTFRLDTGGRYAEHINRLLGSL
ncbi:MAG: ribosome-binding factor A [Candidatus Saccharimonadia bacterium]